ncbi:MAG: hypothetical protein NXI23_21150 [Bacteroidetes bacterium]|jgi:hypothetical protein|nr:hypothetical protein [Bacteroidota bacterium]MDF1867870.1 hypothetical protein [Saprospiraceae bacterium]
MKKLLIFSLLAVFFTCAFTVDAEAQRRGKKKKKTTTTDKYFDESGDFLAKVWYGAGFNLGFNQSSYQGNDFSTFNFGLSPMAGYKISDQFSVGPRFEFAYQGNRISAGQNTNDDIKFNGVNLGLGIFSRFKINQTYFIHAEYQQLNEERPTGVINFQTDKFETIREWSTNYYAGVGYTSGGLVSFEGYALWNFAEEFTSSNIPLEIRFGLNYKF